MKLTIAQAILEEAHFAHVGKFLEKDPTAQPEQHTVNLDVNLLNIENADKAVVRLRVKGDEESQYSFHASYLLLLQIEPEDEDETGPERQRQLAVIGATMLMPMVRECIANLTMRGRFGTLLLPPIDFAESVQIPPGPIVRSAKAFPAMAAVSNAAANIFNPYV